MYEKIQGLCDGKSITFAELSRETGVPKTTLSDLKQGRSKSLSAQNLSKIAQFFGVSVDYFYDSPDGVDEKTDELYKKRKLLFDMSHRATEKQLDSFLEMFEKLINNDDIGG